MNGPPLRRESARERLLQEAEAAVLRKGFAATSIEELIAATGLSKSGFFYHFRDKNDLAKALLVRYLETDERVLGGLLARADELSDDPLHSFLVFLKLFAEMTASMQEAHPGCLIASYCYQEHLFSQDVLELSRQGLLVWRRRFGDRYRRIAARYPPLVPIDLDDLADMLLVVMDGSITMSKTQKDIAVIPKQAMLYRAFVQSIFEPR